MADLEQLIDAQGADTIAAMTVEPVMGAGGEKYGAFGHGYTYSAHPTGAAAAIANLDIIDNEGLVSKAAERGAYMHERPQDAFADHLGGGDRQHGQRGKRRHRLGAGRTVA